MPAHLQSIFRKARFAPGAYTHEDSCTLLQSHIARNEELQLSFYDAKDEKNWLRNYYLGHLTDVVMVDSNMLAAERWRCRL